MNKATVVAALNQVREAHKKWNTARAKYKADETALMRRLALEGALNYMSPEDIAAESGLTLRGVRLMLRADGLDPRRSKTVLSKHAARTLADNAALLGIEPRDMDLTSPLAYLPMGSNLRQVLGASVTADVLDAETGYDEAEKRIGTALALGIETGDVTGLDVRDATQVAAWLASEGIK